MPAGPRGLRPPCSPASSAGRRTLALAGAARRAGVFVFFALFVFIAFFVFFVFAAFVFFAGFGRREAGLPPASGA